MRILLFRRCFSSPYSLVKWPHKRALLHYPLSRQCKPAASFNYDSGRFLGLRAGSPAQIQQERLMDLVEGKNWHGPCQRRQVVRFWCFFFVHEAGKKTCKLFHSAGHFLPSHFFAAFNFYSLQYFATFIAWPPSPTLTAATFLPLFYSSSESATSPISPILHSPSHAPSVPSFPLPPTSDISMSALASAAPS